MLAAVGFLVLGAIIYLIITEKVNMIFCFSIIPIVGALIAGFSLADVSKLAADGVKVTANSTVMLIFAVLYFSIMDEAGMFDGVVKTLSKRAGKNIVGIVLVTAVIAGLSHLDGASATTVMVTIPCMLPIYKKLHMRPELLLFTVGISMGVMNLMPWTSPSVKCAIGLGIEAGDLWRRVVPVQVAAIFVIIGMCIYTGIVEKHRIEKLGLDSGESSEAAANCEAGKKELTPRQRKLVPVNILLTVITLAFLLTNLINTNVMFICSVSLALLINYPKTKDQMETIKKFAGLALMVSGICIASGIFVGVLENTGMLEAMVMVIVKLLPDALCRYLNVIMGIFGMPIGMATGADVYFLGIMPLVNGIAGQFGVDPINLGIFMLIGKNMGLFLCPTLPTVFMALGLIDRSYKDLLKFSYLKAWISSFILLALAVILGVAVI